MNPSDPSHSSDTSKTITLEDVRRVAELASLELTAEEETHMQRDLAAILGQVAQLNQLDTTEIPPMAQVSEILGQHAEAHTQSLRADVPRASLERAAALPSAPDTDGIYFKVPKVIER